MVGGSLRGGGGRFEGVVRGGDGKGWGGRLLKSREEMLQVFARKNNKRICFSP